MRRLLAMLALAAVVLAAASCRNTPSKKLFSDTGQHVLPENRLVELVCKVTVSDIPRKTKEVRLWVPFPTGGRYQRLIDPSIESPASYRPMIRYDERYGTPVLFVLAEAPLPKSFDVEYTLRVERMKMAPHGVNGVKPAAVEPDNVVRERLADRLTLPEDVSEAELAKIVAEVAPADNAPFDRARAIYNYVIDTLEFDNTTTGSAGHIVKDVLVSRKAGPADYARVTVTLLRAAGIPALIENGVLLPEDKTPDRTELTGRAAWVRFYVNGAGWSACDPYLADRFGELRTYMFGGMCANRVQLGAGPGLGLVPKPETGPPAVFAEAIAEADEKPVTVETHIFFRDVSGEGASP